MTIDTLSRIQAASASAPNSWLARGPGPLALDPDCTSLMAQLQLGMSFQATPELRVFLHALGRSEPSTHEGTTLGLVEGNLEWLKPLSTNEVRIRGGWFFPTTSLENVESLWSSPYTLSLSAVNSWIAEEMRFSGLDLRLARDVGAATYYAEFSLLWGNDSLGALLAWRGWSIGQRLSVGNETFPLPNLASLAPGGAFAVQNPSGSQPITRDLDGCLGASLRLAYEGPRVTFTSHLFDNQVDRQVHWGEYAWRTRFAQVGAEISPFSRLTLPTEAMKGQTGMGNQGQSHVQVDFLAWYRLAHLNWGQASFSLRFDHFDTDDRDRLPIRVNANANGENGSAWTAATFWQMSQRWRLVLVWLALIKERDLLDSQPRKTSSDALSLELGFRF